MYLKIRAAILLAWTALSGLGAVLQNRTTIDDCTFLNSPSQFTVDADAHTREVFNRSQTFAAALGGVTKATNAARIEHRTFIDDYILGQLEGAGVPPAPLATDAEFLRRVTLDLTGRIPTVETVVAFLADETPDKRDRLIDSLIGSPEFIDKWTMFFGDLLQVNATASNVDRYQQGRDTFAVFVRKAVQENQPYDRLATQLITAAGDNLVQGEANWIVGGIVPMGPPQDTYDGLAAKTASVFLGINVVDCLLCHDGARHLDAINLWGKRQTRAGMWGLAAFFSPTKITQQSVTAAYSKFLVADTPSNEYLLNTTSGNRSARHPLDGNNRAAPRYLDGSTTAGRDRRQSLAEHVTRDIQFSRNIVNLIWGELMVEPFVSPTDAFDLDRLDPDNPPADPWTWQPTHPELLDVLSRWFRSRGSDVRRLIGEIARSNAYQLSSFYPGEWRQEYVPLYARHYVRRLDAEEIHDAVIRATGVIPTYNMNYQGSLTPLPPVNWAMQFPDTSEPRSNNTVAQFLNSFGRGDRDQTPRSAAGSILQGLNMMNHTFVMQKIHANNAGSLVQRLLEASTNADEIVSFLFMATLSRMPTDAERRAAHDAIEANGLRRGTEDLQWALLNKLDFMHNY